MKSGREIALVAVHGIGAIGIKSDNINASIISGRSSALELRRQMLKLVAIGRIVATSAVIIHGGYVSIIVIDVASFVAGSAITAMLLSVWLEMIRTYSGR